ncbi:MAG: GTPase, partial [Flavobacteriales bacterium]
MITTAIIGRPNVGKSTLFNRLVGKREAITDSSSGVTRDRHYGETEWNGIKFRVIDTGGYTSGKSRDEFEDEIKKQVEFAITEADILLFLVDVNTGITDLDEAIAEKLRKSDKKVFTLVNKVDNPQKQLDATEFYSLGIEKLSSISAINGFGSGDVLDELVEEIKKIPKEEEDKQNNELPRISIVGKPNVGKSSLVNTFLGEYRNV